MSMTSIRGVAERRAKPVKELLELIPDQVDKYDMRVYPPLGPSQSMDVSLERD